MHFEHANKKYSCKKPMLKNMGETCMKTCSEVLICMSVINHVALDENLACAVFEEQEKQLWLNLVGLFS